MAAATMSDLLVRYGLPFVGTFLVAAAGWWLKHWVASPILVLERLRTEVRETIFVVANVGTAGPAETVNQASARVRGLAGKLESLSATASAPVRAYIRFRGYDSDRAVKGLTGLSNSLSDTMGLRIDFRRQIEEGFRLPFSDSDDLVKTVREAIGKGLRV